MHIRLQRTIDDSYDIVFMDNLSQIARDIGKQQYGDRYFLITDTNVRKLYGSDFLAKMKGYGLACSLLSITPGERSKSRTVKEFLEDRLLSLHAGRDSIVIALGGGVVGDIAGFVAATLHRGIRYVHIPTTLLSQVDSSIGGKVAVNHPIGKNLLGAFHQPVRVYVNPSTLQTLSDAEFANGMAEIIKYGCVLDEGLFTYIESNHPLIRKRNPQFLTHLIRRCCELKRAVVQKDERESGLRRILNFGHTIGHALEHLSRHKTPHGNAIAVGMVAEATMAWSLGLLHRADIARLKAVLQAYELPTELPPSTDLKRLCKATRMDKKAKRGIVQYTLIRRIGEGIIGVEIQDQKAARLLSA